MKYFDWLLNNVNSDLDSKIEELERVLSIRDNQVEGLREEIKALNSIHETEVMKYGNTVVKKDRELCELKLAVDNLEKYNNKLLKIEEELNKTISRLNKALKDSNKELIVVYICCGVLFLANVALFLR